MLSFLPLGFIFSWASVFLGSDLSESEGRNRRKAHRELKVGKALKNAFNFIVYRMKKKFHSRLLAYKFGKNTIMIAQEIFTS